MYFAICHHIKVTGYPIQKFLLGPLALSHYDEIISLTMSKYSQGLFFLWVQLDYYQLRARSLDRISPPSESRDILYTESVY